jgi:hypothetical protein
VAIIRKNDRAREAALEVSFPICLALPFVLGLAAAGCAGAAYLAAICSFTAE